MPDAWEPDKLHTKAQETFIHRTSLSGASVLSFEHVQNLPMDKTGQKGYYLTRNGHQQIHTGYLQDAKSMRTGQTPYQHMSNIHPPYIFIRWRPFEVLKMSKTCQWIGPYKKDFTRYRTHSPHGKWTRNACKQTQMDREFYCSLRHC